MTILSKLCSTYGMVMGFADTASFLRPELFFLVVSISFISSEFMTAEKDHCLRVTNTFITCAYLISM